MKLTNISTRHLGNEDTHALSTASIAVCEPKKSVFESSAQAAFEQLKTSTSALGSQLNRNRANALTKEINAGNARADKVWKEIKATLTRNAKSIVDTAKAKTAEELIAFFKPYWHSEELPQNTQVANFTEMFRKYDTAWQNKGKATGIDAAADMLKTLNIQMGALWQQRNDLQGDLAETLPASKLRTETATLYVRFCTQIESQQMFTPSAELETLLHDLNEIRSKYAALTASRQTLAGKKKSQDTTPPKV